MSRSLARVGRWSTGGRGRGRRRRLRLGCGVGGEGSDRGRGRRERVRERDLADRGAVRGGDARSRATRTPTRTRSRRVRAWRDRRAARLVVQNGVGYDTFMNKIESASPSSSRKVIDVQKLLGTAGLDRQPAPVVCAADDAGGRGRAGQGSVGDRAVPRRLLRRQRQAVRRFVAALVSGAEAVRRALSRHAGRDDRAGRGLHAAGGRHGEPDPVRASRRTS